jgi:hypothetical protein
MIPYLSCSRTNGCARRQGGRSYCTVCACCQDGHDHSQDGHDKSRREHDKRHGDHDPIHGVHVLSHAHHDFLRGVKRSARYIMTSVKQASHTLRHVGHDSSQGSLDLSQTTYTIHGRKAPSFENFATAFCKCNVLEFIHTIICVIIRQHNAASGTRVKF